MQTGWGKLGDLGKVTNYFTTLGIPAPALNAYFISGLEFAGGILLAIGLGSRFIAFLLAADMAVAYYARRSRRAAVILFGPRQILRRRSLHLPGRFVDRLDLRPR